MKLNAQILVPSLSGFLYGFTMSIIGAALPSIARTFFLTPLQEGMVASIAMLGALLASAFAGVLANTLGRRQTLLLSVIAFLLGSLLSAAAGTDVHLLTGRFLVGIGGGIATIAAPIYLVETATVEHRGGVANIYQVGIALGTLLAFVSGYFLAPIGHWRMMFALAIVPALIQGLGLFSIPESSPGGTEDTSWTRLLDPSYRSRLLLAIGLFAVQGLSGTAAVFYFAPHIFAEAGFQGEKGPLLATIWIGVIYLAAILFSFLVIDRLGRRRLFLTSLSGMALALCFAAWAYFSGSMWLTAACLLGYIAAYALGVGPVPPLVVAEISPLEIRGHAMTKAGFSGWVSNYVISLTFLPLLNVVALGTVFLLYTAIALVGWVVFWKRLPETKQRSLEEIETMFR